MGAEYIQFKQGYLGSGIRTVKDIGQKQEALNARLLIQGGYINQEFAGVYTYTPLGFEVLKNIENITREYMLKCGSEILMPSLNPLENWERTERLGSMSTLFEAKGANKQSQTLNPSRYILAPTHEEIVTPLAKKYIRSYRDLPLALFQIQTKFRNEARPKSGLLRGREFRMKDLYSFHPDEESLLKFYEHMKEVYMELFNELGLGKDTYITYASGSDFSKAFSHEFQTLLTQGEDTIYLDKKKGIAYNKEIATSENESRLGVKFSELEQASASEIGNIFPLNLKFSKPFELNYTDKDGSVKPVYMGCYGIGTSRLMAVIAEKYADEKGLVWPENVSPAKYHIVSIFKDDTDEAYKLSEKIYKHIGKDSLWDSRREVGAGEKLKDADLIGCPYRIVISPRSIQNGGVELKRRNQQSSEVLSMEQLFSRFDS